MMPAPRLKFPLRPPVLQPGIAFPVSNPCLDGKTQIARSTKSMKMVRHQQVIADEPSFCFRPGFMEKPVRCCVGQPRDAFLGRNGEEDNVGLAKIDMDAGCWILAVKQMTVPWVAHVKRIPKAEADEKSVMMLRLARTLAPPARGLSNLWELLFTGSEPSQPVWRRLWLVTKKLDCGNGI
jgi:hypothetical protein